jgi:thiamine biosynthesis protein ThiS
MQIRINGKIIALPAPLSLSTLLEQLGYRDLFIAVAINQNIIAQNKFSAYAVCDQDEIEILAPMAGG